MQDHISYQANPETRGTLPIQFFDVAGGEPLPRHPGNALARLRSGRGNCRWPGAPSVASETCSSVRMIRKSQGPRRHLAQPGRRVGGSDRSTPPTAPSGVGTRPGQAQLSGTSFPLPYRCGPRERCAISHDSTDQPACSPHARRVGASSMISVPATLLSFSPATFCPAGRAPHWRVIHCLACSVPPRGLTGAFTTSRARAECNARTPRLSRWAILATGKSPYGLALRPGGPGRRPRSCCRPRHGRRGSDQRGRPRSDFGFVPCRR